MAAVDTMTWDLRRFACLRSITSKSPVETPSALRARHIVTSQDTTASLLTCWATQAAAWSRAISAALSLVGE